MYTRLVATCMSIFAIFLSYFFHRRLVEMKWVKMAHFIWLVIPSFFLFTGWFGPTLLLFVLMLAPILIGRESSQIPLFILTFAVIPKYVNYQIPFPGLNYLIDVDISLLFSFMFFLSFLRVIGKNRFTIVDLFIFLFFVYISLLSMRSLPFTSTLRVLFTEFFTIIVPYFVFSKSYKDVNDVQNYLKYFVSAAIILASVGFVSFLKQWDYLSFFNRDYYADYRYGFLRIGSGQSTTFLGYFCGVGLLVYLSGILEKKYKPPFLLIFPLLLLIIFMNFSRGAWLSVVALFLFYSFYKKSIKNRSFIIVILLFFCLIFSIFMFSGWVSSLDDFGTFLFRQQLYDAAYQQFYNAPLFGDVNYLEASYFDPLRLGGGFVDIVSYYLQIVLYYGLIGLVIFIIPFLITIKQLISLREFLIGNDLYRRSGAILTSVLISYLCMILTVSNVENIGLFGWILLAISQAFISAVKELRARVILERV